MADSVYEVIGDGRPDGTIICRTTTEKVAFFGATPVVQQVTAATATDATTAYALANALKLAMTNLGLTT
jgi:hypothetical protein